MYFFKETGKKRVPIWLLLTSPSSPPSLLLFTTHISSHNTELSSASGPLHQLVLLPGDLLPQLSTWLAPLHYLGPLAKAAASPFQENSHYPRLFSSMPLPPCVLTYVFVFIFCHSQLVSKQLEEKDFDV